jgi:hypothetical protein
LEIRINDAIMDFTLENEKNLGEVIEQIDLWLEGSNLALTSITFDDKELLSLPSREWQGIPVEKVKTLKLAAKPGYEVLTTNMETILEFLSLLQKALENHDIKLLGELQDGFSVMTESVIKHLPGNQQTELTLAELSNLINSISWEKTEVKKALHMTKQLAETFNKLLTERSNPVKALNNLALELEQCISEISDVSLLLQTGKDHKAMEAIIRFTELNEKLIRVFLNLKKSRRKKIEELTINGMSLEEFYTELNAILKELVEAFHAQDSVLIGDLLEYEVAPRLESIKILGQDLS